MLDPLPKKKKKVGPPSKKKKKMLDPLPPPKKMLDPLPKKKNVGPPSQNKKRQLPDCTGWLVPPSCFNVINHVDKSYSYLFWIWNWCRSQADANKLFYKVAHFQKVNFLWLIWSLYRNIENDKLLTKNSNQQVLQWNIGLQITIWTSLNLNYLLKLLLLLLFFFFMDEYSLVNFKYAPQAGTNGTS